MSILDLYCSVDAFWQRFEPLWERHQPKKPLLGITAYPLIADLIQN